MRFKYRYDAFGGLYTGITAPYNTQGYTGQTYDPKSGLLDYNARWYSAKTGRFTSKDSFQGFLAQPQTQNLYSYVSNNPVRYTDPTGHWQDGDENLPPNTQLQIVELTEKWFSTDDQAGAGSDSSRSGKFAEWRRHFNRRQRFFRKFIIRKRLFRWKSFKRRRI